MPRPNATQVVAEEIASSLQERIAQWQTERSKIEASMARESRKAQRYELLGELIDEAQREITKAMERAAPVQAAEGVK